jgi:hypothetical protein
LEDYLELMEDDLDIMEDDLEIMEDNLEIKEDDLETKKYLLGKLCTDPVLVDIFEIFIKEKSHAST